MPMQMKLLESLIYLMGLVNKKMGLGVGVEVMGAFKYWIKLFIHLENVKDTILPILLTRINLNPSTD